MAQINRQQLDGILQNAPQGSSPNDVIKGLIKRGHTIEGLDVSPKEITQIATPAKTPGVKELFKQGATEGLKSAQETYLGGEKLSREKPIEGAITKGIGLTQGVFQPGLQGAFNVATPLIKKAAEIGQQGLESVYQNVTGPLLKNTGALERAKEFRKGAEEPILRDVQVLAEATKESFKEHPGLKGATELVGLGLGAEQIPGQALSLAKTAGKAGLGVAKIAGKGISQIGKGIGAIGAEGLGKTTGAGAEVIKEAFKSGEKETFAKALRGEITDEEILNSARKGLETIKEERRIIYGEDYKKLQASPTRIDIEDIREGLKGELENARIGINSDGSLDFSRSTITQPASQRQIQSIHEDINTWFDNSPVGLDILKQRVQDRYLGTVESAKADRFSTIVGNQIKDKIIQEVPEYLRMVKNYEAITNELKDITRTLSLGNEASKMTSITRLNQALRDNLAFRKEALELLERSAGIELKPALAGAALRPIMPKGLAGVIGGGALGYGVIAGLFNPAVVTGLLVSSPRIIGELARGLGLATNTVKQGLNNLKYLYDDILSNPLSSGVTEGLAPLKPTGVRTFKQDVEIEKPKKVLQRTPTEKPNLFKENRLVRLTGPEKGLLEEARKYKSADEFIKKQGKIIYHGGSTNFEGLSPEYAINKLKQGQSELGALFAEGPGVYFTNSIKEANQYGKVIAEGIIGKDVNIISKKSPKFNKSQINEIINKLDKEDIDIAISDWGNKSELLENITKGDNAVEQLQNIWSDVLYGQKHNDFINAVKNYGIDGIEVKKGDNIHTIIYNKDKLKSKSQLADIYNQAHKPNN